MKNALLSLSSNESPSTFTRCPVFRAAFASRQTMRDTALSDDATWTARLAEAFSHRDFIYLVVVLSAFGKAYWFLMLASVGTPTFFLLLLWVSARRRA